MTRSPTAVTNAEHFAAWTARHAPGLCFAGPDPHYGLGLEILAPHLRFVCLDRTPAVPLLRRRGHPVIVARRQGEDGAPAVVAPDQLRVPSDPSVAADDEPRGRSTHALLADRRITEILDGGPRPSLVVFKSSHALEQLCTSRGWRLLAAPARIARRWENKVAFRRIATEMGLLQPEGGVVRLREVTFDDLRMRWGPRLVIQAGHGYAGARTYPVTDQASFAATKDVLRGRRARVTAFERGPTWTLNACVTARGIAVAAPFRQLTGLPQLTPYPLGSCGQDWSVSPPDEELRRSALAVARRIGEGLSAQGYRGLFGVDLLLAEDGRWLLIEVNPRLVASIAAFTQLELAAGRLPLLARHVLAHLDPRADTLPLDFHEEPLQGAQLVLHHVGATEALAPRLASGAARPPAARPAVSPGPSASAGVALSESATSPRSAPSGVRPALRIDELQPGEWLVLAPEPGRILTPGDAWLRMQSGAGALADVAAAGSEGGGAPNRADDVGGVADRDARPGEELRADLAAWVATLQAEVRGH